MAALVDTFTRVVANGMGRSDDNHDWTNVSGVAADVDVDGSKLIWTPSAQGIGGGRLDLGGVGNIQGIFRFAFLGQWTGNVVRAFVQVRSDDIGAQQYTFRAEFGSSNRILCNILDPTSSDAGGGSGVEVVAHYTVGDWYWLRFYAFESALKLKCWKMDTPEPVQWTIQATDTFVPSGISQRYFALLGTIHAPAEVGLPIAFDDLYVTFSSGGSIREPVASHSIGGARGAW